MNISSDKRANALAEEIGKDKCKKLMLEVFESGHSTVSNKPGMSDKELLFLSLVLEEFTKMMRDE